jgi:hypothetical protein
MATLIPWMILVLLLAGPTCCSCGSNGADADTDAAGDTAGDADAEADVHVDPDAHADPEAEPDADATTDADGDGGTDVPADENLDGDAGDGPDANPCVLAGGICTASTMCTTTVEPSGASGCIFDDGPGVCCMPPPLEPTGDTCPSYGGVCATVGACNRVGGWFTPADCAMGASVVCCVVEQRCGPHEWICCTPGPEADFNPTCERTGLTCPFEGTTLMRVDDCV